MWDTLGLCIFESGNLSMKLRVIVAITSATALLEVNKTPSVIRSIRDIQSASPGHAITVAVSNVDKTAVREVLAKNKVSHELVVCDPDQPTALVSALEEVISSCEAILIHDACRPLIDSDQLNRIVKAFTNDVDAVRPAIAFTETLKIVGADSFIEKTLDRDQVRRISTPELIRTSAIEVKGEGTGWFFPLKKDARIEYVDGDPASLRINSAAERDLLESFLYWKEKSN
jgi:2-C-methyl-D-erythritol 4-phosphate cytidylyltransferase